MDDILQGFEDSDDAPYESELREPWREHPSGAFGDLSGYFKVSSAWNVSHKAPRDGETDFRGLSRMRGELDVKLDLNISDNWKARIGANAYHDGVFAINGRGSYGEDYLDDSETGEEFREVYLQGNLSQDADIKIGRQILPWGVSESIRIVDVLNPLDAREFGMTDIESLRLPVAMTRVDYYKGPWSFTGVAVHEIRFNKEPPCGSDFYPLDGPPYPHRAPDNYPESTEFALAALGRFSGWDMGFYAGRFYDDRPHMEINPPRGPALAHSRLYMLGSTIIKAKGNWLLKGEGAYFRGLEFFNAPDEKKSRFDILAGVEYSGLSETTVTVEAVNRHLEGHGDQMENPPDNARESLFQSVIRVSTNFKNDTFHMTFLAAFQGWRGEEGSFQRGSLEYDWTDDLSLTLGGIIYRGGDDLFFEKIKDNDRLFFDIKYSF